MALALARTWESGHNLHSQATCLRQGLDGGVGGCSQPSWSCKSQALSKETGTERQVCTATIRTGVLTLQNRGFENSTVCFKLMFFLFLSLQDNEAKPSKPKCNRSTGLMKCIKFIVRNLKICSRLLFFFPVFLLSGCNFCKLLWPI